MTRGHCWEADGTSLLFDKSVRAIGIGLQGQGKYDMVGLLLYCRLQYTVCVNNRLMNDQLVANK